jgi:cytochrome P450
VAGDGEIEFGDTRRLTFVRNVFRETLRLYPPITFLPRVAAEPTMIGRLKAKRGAMLMIAPWVLHRHSKHWQEPHRFDPDRFAAGREEAIAPATYLPFGLGPRTCVGAGFAQTEATLILARLVRRYDLIALAADKVRPVARLTTRPAEQIMCHVTRRQA